MRISDWSSDVCSSDLIAAASSLKFALEEVAARFEADTGRKVALSFGSSGTFYRQIIQGAPFQMFLSADAGFVEQLAGAGKTVDRGRLSAVGRIVLFVPPGPPLRADARPAGLSSDMRRVGKAGGSTGKCW